MESVINQMKILYLKQRILSLHILYRHIEVGVDKTRWVWTRRGGCGQDEVGVNKMRWVWTRRGGCRQDEVGVANKNTYVRVHNTK